MKNKYFLLGLLLCLISCEPATEEKNISVDLGPEIVDKWQILKSQDGSEPIARHEAAFVQVGDKFVLFGGRRVQKTSIFDINTQSWSEGAEPLIEMHHFQPVVFDDKIYVLGALTGGYPDETPIPNVHIYDPAMDEWTIGDEIPEERRRGSTGNVVYNGSIYMSCGIKNGHIGDHKKWLDRYDPVNHTWEVLPDAPRERDHFQAAVMDDKLYNLGGRLSKAPEDPFSATIGEVDYFDLKEGAWKTVADPIPTQRAGNFVVNVGDEMWVLGGESASQTHAHQEVEALKVNAHTWRSLPNMNQGRHGTGAIVYENKVFVASGCGNRGGQPELTQMEAFLPAGVSLVPFYDYTPSTTVSIEGEKFFINDKPTYEGREWNGHPVEGLLMNSRMVQGIFDDTNRETRGNWRYPDGGWNPYRNTREFVAAMPAWREHGLLSFTLNMQGGSPMGYGNKDWINTPYDSLGNLDYSYMMRLEQILKKADELEMVVILGLFYFGQDEELKDEKAIYAAIDNTIDWLMQRQYRNVIIEVNNECDVSKYDHEILKPSRVAELIKHIKAKEVNGFRFLTGTSFGGGSIPTPEIAKASDFILIHGNGVKQPTRITEMVQQTREILAEDKKPILFNEDDHYDFDKEENNFAAAVKAYASWGYFDFRREGEEFEEGYQSMPADWGIGSERKKAFFEMVKLVTGS